MVAVGRGEETRFLKEGHRIGRGLVQSGEDIS